MEERQPKRAKFTEASSSSTSVIANNYYVFPSFRGSHTRKDFVDHLYHKLLDVGLPFHPYFVFRDDENLHFGEPISENLLSAIKHFGQIVLPVLYKVRPKDVKRMQGKFGEAFKSSVDRFDEEVKQQGLEALKKALTLRVYESGKFASGHEGKLVKELVKVIMGKQQHDFLPPLPRNLVGIDDRVAEVMKSTDTNPSKTQIIGICGIGGIGMTTLATNIYNKLSKKFEWRSFLMDIRETIDGKGMEHIQSLLISDITKSHESRVRDSLTGIGKIQLSCEKKKVFILLDDVGHQDHIDKLIGGCNFELGSRIIITCRDKALLKSQYKSYELKEMNRKDSMLLFSLYAFEAEQPPMELVTLSSDIVATTGGLPLALEIIGSSLKRKDKNIWRETLEKLRKLPHTDVQKKLKRSYNALEHNEKQIFLDIACFFIGYDKKIATYLWKDLRLCPDSTLARMIELSLIKYDDNNELRMHDQLRDLGRAIAHPEGMKLWLCRDEEAMKVLKCKEKNEKIEALRLDKRGSREFMKRKSFKRMPNLKFLHVSNVEFDGDFKDSLSELRWLKWEKCPDSFKATNVHLEKLLILDLSNGIINENWGGWSSIKMERLKVLNLYGSIFSKKSPNLSAFKSLEMLTLESCERLKEIDPSIGDVKCLISLNLSWCYNLKKLPSQLGELRALVSLNSFLCQELQELPKETGKLEELKELIIESSGIKEIPPWIGSLKKLEVLNAQSCISLVKLPDLISHLVNLSNLDLRFCFEFEEISESIGSLVKLQCLLLGNMHLPSEHNIMESWNLDCRIHYIPHSIGKLESLIELHLSCAKISKLPESIEDLKILKIAKCKKLSSLPNTISKLGKLEELNASACKSLEGEVPTNRLSSLKILRLEKLSGDEEILLMGSWMTQSPPQSIRKLSSLQHIYLTNCDLPASLTVLEVTCQNRTLPQLSHLIHLKELSFQYCELLESIPMLPSRILKLGVSWCWKLKELPSLSSMELLSELHIKGCSEMIGIKGLEGLKSLGKLFIWGCKKFSNLNDLEHLESLRSLKILDASLMNDDLFKVQCLGRLKNIEMLHIDSCQSLIRLNISQLTRLTVLWVTKCIERLKKLRFFSIQGCDSIEILLHLSLFDNLQTLGIGGCWKLHDVQGLEKVRDVLKI